MNSSRNEIKALTGLRGVAASAVMAYHFANPYHEKFVISRFDIAGGYMAVDAFFVLSGFVLAYNYGDAFVNGGTWCRYLDFMYKRFARIYPAYFGVMLIFLAKMTAHVSGGTGPISVYNLWDYTGNLLMFSGWGLDVKGIIGPSWSVSAEILCYLIFPVIAVFALGRYWLMASLASLLGIFLVAGSGLGVKGPLDVISSTSFFPMLRAVCGFTLGVACCTILQARPGRQFSDALWYVLYPIFALVWIIDTTDMFRYATIIVLIMGLARGGYLHELIFANRVTYYLGKISYSMYLIHAIFIGFFMKFIAAGRVHLDESLIYWTAFIIYVAIVILASSVSYRILEVGGRQALHRLRPAVLRRLRPV